MRIKCMQLTILLSFVVAKLSYAQTNVKIPLSTWANLRYESRAEKFLEWLILGCTDGHQCNNNAYRHVEYEGYDGFYNNLAKPLQGAIDTPLLRLLPPVYSDGSYSPVQRPTNPLTISQNLLKGENGKTSRVGNTAFLLFFGQQVVEEVLDAQGAACPPEYFNIDVPEGHEYRTEEPKLKILPLLRTRYDMRTGFSPNNPRQQLNEITPYIDGGLVYGAAKGWADALRINHKDIIAPDGQLAWHSELLRGFPAENSQRLPMANPPPPANHTQYVERGFTANVNRFFKLGNPRGNENPFLLTFGIFWFRWHNVIAKFLKRKNPNWNGERVFNEARKWVIATQQSVTVYDWLPKYLKNPNWPKPYYKEDANGRKSGGYDPTVDPQISHIFQSAAMRFGHTLVPSGVYLRKRNNEGCDTIPLNLDPSARSHSSHGVRTCNSFWRSPELFTMDPKNFERFIMGMSSQTTEEEDNIIVEDLRGRVFGPLEFSRRDLMAVNIQRARDHGLPDYNTARKHFGLEPLNSLEVEEYKNKTKTKVPDEVLQRLRTTYNNKPDEVDIWPGGLLETTDGPGQLFSAVIINQFERIRAGDRFWFENQQNKINLFTPSEIERIKQIKIIDIVLSVADINLEDIQEDPFTAPRADNTPTGNNCTTKLTHEVSCKIYNTTSNSFGAAVACKYLPALGNHILENCTRLATYDYFDGSQVSFILTFLFTGVACLALFLGVNIWTLLLRKKKTERQLSTIHVPEGQIKCKERVSFFERRIVIISFDEETHKILVKATNGKILRAIELYGQQKIVVIRTENYQNFLIRAENHYDLYLLSENAFYMTNFLRNLKMFCEAAGQHVEEQIKTRAAINRDVVTAKDREQQLAQFMSFVLENQDKTDANFVKPSWLKTQLTFPELADALAMSQDSIFVSQLFNLMDMDQSGFITAQEFAGVMLKLSKGTVDEKAEILFYIYDLNHSGSISAEDFKMLIESTLGGEMKDTNIDEYIASMLQVVGLGPGDSMTFSQFKDLFMANEKLGSAITVDIKQEVKKTNSRFSRFSIYGDHSKNESSQEEYPMAESMRGAEEEAIVEEVEEDKGPIKEAYFRLVNFFKINEKILFWRSLYTLVMFLIFAERAYYYSVEREHAGLRRIAGYGVTVTRGAASAMMFTYSTLLITMCRNILSALRSSFLHWYYPFDDMVEMHKYIGWWALVWTLVHVIGHAINFYHISTQTPPDLSCLFRNFFRPTHVLPKFHYWCWETVTGLTGVALTLQVALIYVFAANARQNLFRLFWITHNSYPIFYFLTILHGSGQLVQEPFFHLYFLGPCILFTIDKIISISRKSVKIVVLKAVHLPSNVTLLYIQRPLNFSYLSGQWVRIASLGISTQEFHPFTLSSAPHEKHLTLHIRGVGPWTNKLRKVYPDHQSLKADPDFKYPMIYIDGPFGEGHQNWYNYEIAVLVGGGIGVTPFASILKDIVFKCKQPSINFKCKKVIFLWVTRSQKQFEWMTDILTQVEEADTKNIIRIHIFITQFKSKYDLRTFMLYHAERRFQKVHGRSLFTGLRALTHFSRPSFHDVFKSIKERYLQAPVIGVFTCGAPSLSTSVEDGCRSANTLKGPILQHYYENF